MHGRRVSSRGHDRHHPATHQHGDAGVVMKTCTRCRQAKPPEEFRKRRSSKDGLDIYCKDCANAMQRELRKANPLRYAEYSRKYYYSHLEERRARNRAYSAAHREYYAAKYREWAEAHKEAVRAYQRHYKRGRA